ncbi:MAG: aminotransferase class I/II-fold pyridoxal phosphate-dependent enzyme, partial [Anaerolineales bacterium]|nr:aminotransferase class I/II-fold pyridoxal phosphate-dependent enzyme [Anaerolineales bacterium]
LSKSHNMAGWRVGVVVGNTQALEALYVLKSHADSGHFLPILDAATEALKTGNEWITGRNEIYRKRRDLVVERLKTLGAGFRIPRGAIYLWFQVPAGMASNTFTESLLKDTGVSLAPGSIFGTRGEGYARLSLCVPEGRLHEAMERLISWWLQNAREGGEDA